MCASCGCHAPASSQAKNGIPAHAAVPSYDPNAKPWTPSPESKAVNAEIKESK